MEINWDAYDPPSDWKALPFCRTFKMCRYWNSAQLLEFVPNPRVTDIRDLFFGVPADVYEHLIHSGPFVNQVLEHHLSLVGTRGHKFTAYSSSELQFKLPNRDAATPKPPSSFGFGPLED